MGKSRYYSSEFKSLLLLFQILLPLLLIPLLLLLPVAVLRPVEGGVLPEASPVAVHLGPVARVSGPLPSSGSSAPILGCDGPRQMQYGKQKDYL